MVRGAGLANPLTRGCKIKTKLGNLMSKGISMKTLGSIALITLGVIFLFSGIGKLIKPPALENIWVAGILGGQITGWLWLILPFLEIAIGVCLVTRFKIKWVSWAAMALIINFIVNNVWLISIGKGFESCGQCLGWGIDTWPIGSMYMDLMMIGFLLLGVKSHVIREREVIA